VNNWDVINVKIPSSTQYSTQSQLVLTIWWVTSTFSVTTKPQPSSWGGSGGGWSSSSDYCPNWDTSLSYYDGKCSSTTTTTASWVTTTVEVTATWVTTTITTNTWTFIEFVPKFDDINDSFAKDDINELVSKWIITWYSDWTFRPLSPMTRAEFLAVAMKSLSVELNLTPTTTYTDIPAEGSWMIKYLNRAQELWIANGQMINGKLKFRPNDSISRAEAIAILINVAKIGTTATATTNFSDIPSGGDWMIKYLDKAQTLWIAKWQMIDGTLKFRPNDSISRAEAVKVIVNTMHLQNQ
jgi:hypothetical protein